MVVGSYVPKTTAQLEVLLRTTNVYGFELDVAAVLAAQQHSAGEERSPQLQRIVAAASKELNYQLYNGRDVVLYTSRGFHEGARLQDTAAVSRVLSDIVEDLVVQPAFVVAKGGITSHDVAQHGLHMTAAKVLGQIEPGVPVWQAGIESRFPRLNYVVFPGNVGDDQALARVAKKLGVRKRHEPLDAGVASGSSTRSTATMLDTLRSAQREGGAVAAFNICELRRLVLTVQPTNLYLPFRQPRGCQGSSGGCGAHAVTGHSAGNLRAWLTILVQLDLIATCAGSSSIPAVRRRAVAGPAEVLQETRDGAGVRVSGPLGARARCGGGAALRSGLRDGGRVGAAL